MNGPPIPAGRYDEHTLKLAGLFAWDAVSALTFITDPEKWPAFVAWAEQLGPGEQWNEDDYNRMCMAARYFLEVANAADTARGVPPDEP